MLRIYTYILLEDGPLIITITMKTGAVCLRIAGTLICYRAHTFIGGAIEEVDDYFICHWSDGTERGAGYKYFSNFAC
jgi:hypothetical protein